MKILNIAVVGSTSITKNAINIMRKNNIDIKLIITKKKDEVNSDYVNLRKEFSKIKLVYDKDLKKKNTYLLLKKLKINFIFCMGWSHIIPYKIIFRDI